MKKSIYVLASLLIMLVVSCSDNPAGPSITDSITGRWYVDFDNSNITDGYSNFKYISNSILEMDGEKFNGAWQTGSRISDYIFNGTLYSADKNGNPLKLELNLQMITEVYATGRLTVTDVKTDISITLYFKMNKRN